jgi:hypothetical protein
MGKKRTLQDVEKALAWRYHIYPDRHRAGIIGAARYKCYGFSSRNNRSVIYGDTITPFKTHGEVESAVWSQVASQPVAGKLLRGKGK